jgi:hypothetical protein
MATDEPDLYVLAARHRSRVQRCWAIGLCLVVAGVIALIAMVGPASGAAGGCGGG